MSPDGVQRHSARPKLAVFLIGAPGVGKSTAARRLADALGCHAFQSGQVLREAAKNAADPRLRRLIDARMRRSLPMPIDVYCRVLQDNLPRGTGNGLVLDGFPRTVEQCADLPRILGAAGLSEGRVIGFVLHAPEHVMLARSAARRVCGVCGSEIQAESPCCRTPQPVVRADDVRERLLVRSRDFHELLPSVRELFAARWPCFDIDASGSRDEVAAAMTKRLQRTFQCVDDL